MELKRILIDTNAYVGFKEGKPEAIAILERAPAIGVNTVVLGELLCGFAAGAREAINRQELAEFLATPGVTILPVDQRTSEQYAAVYAALRKAGRPIPTTDMWIAASAIQNGSALFSYDQHFQMIEGLHVGASCAELEA